MAIYTYVLFSAICWCSEPDTHEVIVQGLKQGVNTKLHPTRKSSVSISKRRIFEEFQNLVTQTPMDERPLTLCNESSLSSYNSYKQTSTNYQLAKKCFLTYFSIWQRNDPQYEKFEV